MKLFLCLVVVIVAVAFRLFGTTPQLRGLHDDIFVSNARPALAVEPGAGLRLVEDGWCDVQPDSRVTTPGGARVWYALYAGDAPERRLLVLLTEADNGWRWPHGLPGEHHVWARRVKHEINGLMAHQGAYVLAPADDPWAYRDSGPWASGSFTQRYVMLTQFNRVKLVVEYREPVRPTAAGIPPLEDVDALVGLKERADAAFRLLRRDGGDVVPEVMSRPEKAPAELSRRALARWLGGMQREGRLE